MPAEKPFTTRPRKCARGSRRKSGGDAEHAAQIAKCRFRCTRRTVKNRKKPRQAHYANRKQPAKSRTKNRERIRENSSGSRILQRERGRNTVGNLDSHAQAHGSRGQAGQLPYPRRTPSHFSLKR